MKKLFAYLFLLIVVSIYADDIIEINFFNHPRFDFFDFDTIEEKIKTNFTDSTSTNIFSGRILSETESDIFVLAFLNAVGCHFASPTDYMFKTSNRNLNFRIIASNISSDSLTIYETSIIESDSMRVGIFSLYTPDFLVKNDVNPYIEFDYGFFEKAEKLAGELAEQTDFVIMLSNLSRYIDSDITYDQPIDFVFSFDYQVKNDGLLANKNTYFATLDSSLGSFGKLILKYHANEIIYSWEEIEF